MSNHGAKNIGDPKATFGVTEGNPLWEELRDIALRVGQSFLLNVTLNEERGNHRRVCRRHHPGAQSRLRIRPQVRDAKGQEPFRHRGHDEQRLSARHESISRRQRHERRRAHHQDKAARSFSRANAAKACRRTVRWTSCCRARTARKKSSRCFSTPGFVRPEQWQAQIQALIQRRAKVLALQFTCPTKLVQQCFLTPCHDIAAAVRQRLTEPARMPGSLFCRKAR